MKTAEKILEKLKERYELAYEMYKSHKNDKFKGEHEINLMWEYAGIANELKDIIDWIESEE